MSQYNTNGSTNFSDNGSSFNVWDNYNVTDNRSQLLAWLSLLEPKLRHRDIQERRVDDAGECPVQSEEFRRCCGLYREDELDNAVLFCYGNPGVGKIFIGQGVLFPAEQGGGQVVASYGGSSLVVDRLCNQARGQDTVVTCFYF